MSDVLALEVNVSPKIDTDGAIITLEGYEDVAADIFPGMPQASLNAIEWDISYREKHIVYVIMSLHLRIREQKY